MLMRSLRYTAKLTATAAVTLTTCYAIVRDMIVHDTLLTVAVATVVSLGLALAQPTVAQPARNAPESFAELADETSLARLGRLER